MAAGTGVTSTGAVITLGEGGIGTRGAARAAEGNIKSSKHRTSSVMPTLCRLIGALTVSAPTAYRGLSVYPLGGAAPSSVFTYLGLDDALATGQFRVTEGSDGGVVPRLLALNETDSPVLLLDGEELVG